MKSTARLSAFLVCLSFASNLCAEEVLIRARKVYTMTGPALTPGAVLVKDGKIAKVAEKLDAADGVRVVDLADGVLMPGLVNAKTNWGVDGGDAEMTREIDPDFDVLRAVDWRSRSFREALGQGVTTAVIFPGDDAVIAGPAGAVKTAGEPNGKRAFAKDLGLVANMGTAPGNGNRSRTRPDSIYVRQPTNRMGVVWMLRATLRKAAGDASSPYADSLAGKKPFFVTAHVDADIDAMLRLADEFKFKPILFGGEEAPQCAEKLAKEKVPVVLDAVSTTPTAGAEGADPFWNQAGVLHKAGVTVAIAGDRPLDKARFAARYGLPADVALAAVTSAPAKIVGIDARVGSIAEGKDADLVAFDGEPLEFTTSLRWTAVAGVIPSAPPQVSKSRSQKGDSE